MLVDMLDDQFTKAMLEHLTKMFKELTDNLTDFTVVFLKQFKIIQQQKYDEMRKVFDDFHAGQGTKTEVAFAIGLWQRSYAPSVPPTIDRTKEYWKRYEEYFHDKAVEACKKSSKKYRIERLKYRLYIFLHGGRE